VSDYRFIAQVTSQLVHLFRDLNVESGQGVSVPISPEHESPKELSNTGANLSLSVWLYQVTENESAKNQALQRVNGGGSQVDLVYPPLPLNLYYLLTPMMEDQLVAQRTIGRAMAVLHDNAIFNVPDSSGSVQEMRVTLWPMDLEEITRVWEALQEPYRLSVCYQVRIARIHACENLQVSRVTQPQFGTATKPGPGRE
jgi:hypothetical protein